jgi:pre-60S factor REI1
MDPATASVSSASASAVPGSAAEAASRAAASSAEQSQQEQQWEEWDVRRSLFDNFMSASMEANLEYMYKKYGVYFPDAEYLVDPEGLLKYLGLKLQYGHVPLYVRGDDTNAKQFASLHAVQRHMVDANRCKMVFEDNEEEYEDFYDWSKLLEGEEGKELVVADVDDVGNGFELAVGGTEGRPVKFLGSREFARYYRQRPRLDDGRDSVSANRILSKYRALGIATAQPEDVEIKRARKQQKRHERLKYKNELKANVIRNLPKNVTF